SRWPTTSTTCCGRALGNASCVSTWIRRPIRSTSMTEPSVPASDRAAAARRAIGLIDLTDLADDHAPDGIPTLCARAREHRTAAVCGWPEYVAPSVEALAGADVRVATVVNFPSGDEPIADVVDMAAAALAAGADDVDLVLPYSAFLVGDRRAGEMVAAVAVL